LEVGAVCRFVDISEEEFRVWQNSRKSI